MSKENPEQPHSDDEESGTDDQAYGFDVDAERYLLSLQRRSPNKHIGAREKLCKNPMSIIDRPDLFGDPTSAAGDKPPSDDDAATETAVAPVEDSRLAGGDGPDGLGQS